jgi:hypothetical protein
VLIDEVVHQGVAQRYQVFEVGLGVGVVLRQTGSVARACEGNHVAGKIVVAFLAPFPSVTTYETKQLSATCPGSWSRHLLFRAARMASSECAGPEISWWHDGFHEALILLKAQQASAQQALLNVSL